MFWFTIVVGIASMVQAIYAGLSYHQGGAMQSKGSSVLKRPYRNLVLLVFLIWGAVAFDYYDRHYAQPISKRFNHLFSEWGAGNNECYAKLDVSRILDFSKQYEVAFVCGIENPSVDTLNETLISVSNSYHIVPSQIFMTTLMRKAMRDDLSQNPKGHMWYYAILVPRGIDVGTIRQLADVKRYGGKILNEKYFEE